MVDEDFLMSSSLTAKLHKQATMATAAQSANTLPSVGLLSRAEHRQLNRLPKATENEKSRTEHIRKRLGALGRQEFFVAPTTMLGQLPKSRLNLVTNVGAPRPTTGSRLYDSIRQIGEKLTLQEMTGGLQPSGSANISPEKLPASRIVPSSATLVPSPTSIVSYKQVSLRPGLSRSQHMRREPPIPTFRVAHTDLSAQSIKALCDAASVSTRFSSSCNLLATV